MIFPAFPLEEGCDLTQASHDTLVAYGIHTNTTLAAMNFVTFNTAYLLFINNFYITHEYVHTVNSIDHEQSGRLTRYVSRLAHVDLLGRRC